MPSVRPISKRLTIAASLFAGLSLAGCGSDREDGLDQVVTQEAQKAEQAHDYETAIRYYTGLYSDHRDDVSVIEGFARTLRHAGRLQDAERVLADGLKRLGPQPRLVLEKARIDIAEGHADLAAQALEPAVRAVPLTDWEVLTTLAIAYDRLGRYDEAGPHYLAAIALNPGNADILNNYALSRALAGHMDDAVTILKKAAAMASAGSQIHENLAFLTALQRQPHHPGTLLMPVPAVK